jgi:hypothetical protein
VALLGLDRDENLFLDDEATEADGTPATCRPSSSADRSRSPCASGGDEPMIHVDLDDARVVAAKGEGAGEPVFLPAGGNSPYLQHVARLLGVIYDGLEISKAMFAAFEAANLIEPVDVEIKLDEHTQYDLPDLYTISQARFAEPGRRGAGGAASVRVPGRRPMGLVVPGQCRILGRAEEPQARRGLSAGYWQIEGANIR